FFFFFFSSRRRHTRLQGDWSSDVCSSDLSTKSGSDLSGLIGSHKSPPQLRPSYWAAVSRSPARGFRVCRKLPVGTSRTHRLITRSEERRVGKECRSRWSTDH